MKGFKRVLMEVEVRNHKAGDTEEFRKTCKVFSERGVENLD